MLYHSPPMQQSHQSHNGRVAVGFHYPHHNEESGYDRIAPHLDARYVCLDRPLGNRRVMSIPMGPLTRVAGDLIAARRARGARLVHFLYPENHLWLAGRLSGAPVTLATVHHPFDWYWDRVGGGGRLRRIILSTVRPALRRLNGIILLEPTEVPRFADAFPHARVTFIPHGVADFSRFAKPAATQPGALRIVVVGINYRDWETLRHVVDRAQRERPGWRFHLVGASSAGVALASQYSVVQAEPRLSQPQYLELMGAADVNFLPLNRATANNALLEAHSVGTPTLISNLPSVEPYCLSTTLRYANADEAFATLDRLDQDRDHLQRLSRQTLIDVRRLHWPAVAEQVHAFYRELGG